jgi:hypothetical protein
MECRAFNSAQLCPEEASHIRFKQIFTEPVGIIVITQPSMLLDFLGLWLFMDRILPATISVRCFMI